MPSAIKKCVFTIFVDDNVDKNSSSVDAKQNFHRTGVTVLQFPTAELPGQVRKRKLYNLLTDSEKVMKCDALASFATVHPIKEKIKDKAFYPVQTTNINEAFRETLNGTIECELKNEDEWLDLVTNEDPIAEASSWTSHHEARSRDKSENITTINVPLPLIDYKSSAIELQYHLMKMATEYTNYLNPEQTAVGVSDLPLYALKKTIQLACPGEFGSNYFCFMGGLHIAGGFSVHWSIDKWIWNGRHCDYSIS